MEQSDFLYPHAHYRGEVKPENLVFNANLQEFAHRVSYICSLESNGKFQPEEAYNRTEELWNQLKYSKDQLGVGKSPFS